MQSRSPGRKASNAAGDPSLQALRVSESRYRRLFETARDGILLLNADTGQIEDVNPYMVEMLGYSHDEFLGKKLWEVGTFADIPHSKEMFRELQAQGYVRYDDLPLRTIAGARIQVEFVSNSYDCEGTKVIQCNIRNITERKLAERKLRLLRLAIDASMDSIYVTDPVTMRFVDVNSAACHRLGYTREQLLGMGPQDVLGGDAVQLEREYREVIAAGDRGTRTESSFVASDGGRGWTELYRRVFHVDGGSLIVSVGRDITERKRAEDDLLRFRLAMDSSADMIVLVDRATMRFVDVNTTACRLLGYTREELLALPPEELLPHSRAELEDAYDRQIADPSVPGGMTSYYRCKDGSRLPFESKRQVLRSGDRILISVVSRDIRERIQAESALRSAVSLLSATLESTADGILAVAEDHSISQFNQRFVEMWRIPPEIIESRDDKRAIDFVLDQVKDPAAFIAKVEELYASPEAESFDTIEFKDGRTFERYSRPQYVAQRPVGRVWSFRDITERRRADERIHALAFHDSLTELPNRVLFRDRMDQATARAHRAKTKVALLFLDLDNFKTINDSLGHVVGDALLRMVAERLSGCTRDTDTISRQGGDEFLIMLTDLPETDAAMPVVQKLMDQFHTPFEIEGSDLTTSVSIGIALYPDDGEDFDTLLKRADTAMYRAKDAGKNTYRFFDPHMNVDAVEHLSMRNGLRQAVQRGEFVLHYQPQFDLKSGEIVGAEALIRWNHPQHGQVAPARFIPVAEECGLIVPIGEWVLRQACRQAAAWRKAGRTGMAVAVNLSAAQFTRGSLDKTVIGALEESGIDPSMLELELTESILIRDTEATLATVKRLKSLGLRLSIDDFGTGYSSLSYLKRFEVDKLKIDQSFIRDLAVDPENAAIVRSIIQMAHSLGLRTIAEGVEHESLLHYLRIYHCDEAQGFHFGYPMPADEFAEYLARNSKSARSSPVMH